MAETFGGVKALMQAEELASTLVKKSMQHRYILYDIYSYPKRKKRLAEAKEEAGSEVERYKAKEERKLKEKMRKVTPLSRYKMFII